MQPESGGFLWFKTGKTVDCYRGILAVSRLIQELDPRQMKGEVVFLPIANEGGFYKEIKQLVPEDGVNLNRAFPGTEMGSRSAKIAAAVETYLYPDADFLVDLHSGDIHEMVVPFAFFPVAAGETVEKGGCSGKSAVFVVESGINGEKWSVQLGSAERNPGSSTRTRRTGTLDRTGGGCISDKPV